MSAVPMHLERWFDSSWPSVLGWNFLIKAGLLFGCPLRSEILDGVANAAA